jgi:hypothetical protein
MRTAMLKDPINQLLTAIHRNVDRVCEDLQHDRPDLAASVREHASWIPRPEDLGARDPALTTTNNSLGALHPLFYDALAEGLIDARQFDVLMVERVRAARALDERGRQ